MRRKPHVLAIVVGAAAVLLLSAPALGAGVLSTETFALSGPQIQESPAIAIDPSSPAAALSAAVVADEGPIAHATATSSANWTAAGGWSAETALPHTGSAPSGQADVAWGIDAGADRNVYAVDVGSSQPPACAMAVSQFWSSDNGGASYGSPLPVNIPTNLSEGVEPAIAFDRASEPRRTSRSRGSTSPMEAAPDRWSPRGSWSPTRRTTARSSGLRTVSPFGLTAHYRSPSVAVLPDGRVIVAFRNDTATGSTVETEVCDLTLPLNGHYCGPANVAAVGPSTVLGDATAPGSVSGLAGATTPSVVAAGGRVTVAWHAQVGGAVRAFAAMSTDNGATFGPAQQIDPASPGNQIAPRLAADAQSGRVDVAYEWDAAGTGTVLATAVSAGPPLAGATTEAWAQPVVVQAVGASASQRAPGSDRARPRTRRCDCSRRSRYEPAAGDRRGLHGYVAESGQPGRARRRAAARHRTARDRRPDE